VKVRQNTSVDRAFRHFLEVNKKALRAGYDYK